MNFSDYKRFEATLNGFKRYFGIDIEFFKNLKLLAEENKRLLEENKELKANYDKLVEEINASNKEIIDQVSDLAKEFKVQVSTRYVDRISHFEGVNLDGDYSRND